MIAITNEAGETLQLFADQNLITEQAVAWLTDDELPAEISYPIDAPLNDANKKFVGYGYRVDAALPRQNLPVSVQLEGVLYRRCVFSFKVQNGNLNGYLKIDSAEVYDKLRKLSLLEAFPDVIRLGTGIIDAVGNVTPILADRMKAIAAMPPGQFPLTFFPIRNETFYEDSLTAETLPGFTRQTYVNVWQRLPTGQPGFHQDGGFVPNEKGFTVVPQFYLSWVLERIMALAGYRIESSWLASDEVQRLVIVNQTAINSKIGPIFSDPTGILHGHRVTAGMHLPDMSVSDFLKAIKGRFGLVFGFNANTRTCYMERFLDVVRAGAAIDLTDYQSGSYDIDSPEQKGFSVEEFIDEGDDLFKDQKGHVIRPAPYVTGKGGQPISLKVGTCQMIIEPSPLSPTGQTAQWQVPTMRQAGNTLDPTYKVSQRYLNDQGKRQNDIGLKLLSYRGMTQDSAGHLYPFATNDVRDGRQIITGSQALTISGRYGAWRQFLRAYYYFRDNTQKVSVPLLLPVAVLAQLQLHRAVALCLEDQIRRIYLISKLQADSPGLAGKSMVRLEVLSLPSGIDQAADVDDPIVWVEWVASAETRTGSIGNETTVKTYSVKFWADQAKTTPAVVSNLDLTLRRKRYVGYDALTSLFREVYDEGQLHYTANGTTQVLETNYIIMQVRPVISDTGDKPNSLRQTLQLDPGEGYNLLT
ncbi:hypothetical protein G8759_20110 [Spirosoma aureum]|uniref:Uncharacterized protein n=1 Tax=Spirosoma aureum TaxID=2692134 RepID=A0A6G9AQK5_9BACT|nr:hypothetical protein [Spirosoma aureum]QIP14757.1 hypothetical protein G8759_20110 [Spirosoma aureum]